MLLYMNLETPQNRKTNIDIHEQEKWDAILAGEGLPAELESTEEELSEGMKQVYNEMRRHYVERKDADWGAHRQKLQEIKSNIDSYRLSPQDNAFINEDLLRTIEDEVSDMEREAHKQAQFFSQKNPQMIQRPEHFERQLIKQLRKRHSDYAPDILATMAHHAIENVRLAA